MLAALSKRFVLEKLMQLSFFLCCVKKKKKMQLEISENRAKDDACQGPKNTYYDTMKKSFG